ncbi:MAG TPA: DUF6232 family protein [Cyclobacteriaceae bacterium]|nr:DUF6232 family protein [Cyclobacteriaceae bacterium]
MDNAQKYYFGQAHKTTNPNDSEPVTVNKFSLRVGNRLYRLDDISKYRIVSTSASRVPGLVTIALGIVFFVLGVFNGYYSFTYFPSITVFYDYVPGFALYDRWISKFDLLEWTGVALFLFGLLSVALIRRIYILRIVLVTEVMDVFASRNQEKLVRIVEALNKETKKSQHR